MTEHRFYGDLAPWWPLLSPVDEYAEEAAFAAALLSGAATLPGGAISPLVDATRLSREATTPAGETAAPARDAAAPARETAAPARETSRRPAGDAAAPACGTATPACGTATPAGDAATPASEDAALPDEAAAPPGDVAAQAGDTTRRARDAVTLLELGSGGGHNAVHLKKWFSMTLVDLSAAMLAVSERLNPEVEHRQGDMRDVRLGRVFDAVFVHDAIEYMVTEGDLRRAMVTAFVHTRPGGRAVFVPDATAETFVPETDHGGSDAPDGRGARYLSWSYDPDPGDTTTVTDYAFLLRDADGRVTVAHETHETGLFPRDTWLRLLRETGFRPEAVTEQTTEDRTPRTFFVAHRPG